MKHKLITLASALLLTFGLVACGGDENTTDTTADTIATDVGASTMDTMASDTASTAAGQLDQTAQEFVTKAAQAGLAEVSMGQLGEQKAQNADVKAFASKMVTEHTANNQELQQIVVARGLTPPTDVEPTSKAAIDHLQGLSGAEFDQAFMMHMVDDHQKAVDLFTNAQNSVQDPELQGYVTKTLPVLQQHLQAAKDTQAKVK